MRIVPALVMACAPRLAALDRPLRPASSTHWQSASTVELIGLSGQRRSVGLAEFGKMPHVEAVVSSHNVQGRYRGVSLGELLRAEGPFRLIVPDEKRPARWAKKVVRIRLVAIE